MVSPSRLGERRVIAIRELHETELGEHLRVPLGKSSNPEL
jgi:hypothetical protein